MSNNEEQKKDGAGANPENEAGANPENEAEVNPENEKSAEVSSTPPDSPVAGGSQEPKKTEEAGECSSTDLPGQSADNKESVATGIINSDDSSHPQLKRKSDLSVAYPGFFTKTMVIEISDGESDSDSEKVESSPTTNGPHHFEESN